MPFKPARIEIWVGDDHGLLQKAVLFDAEGRAMMSQDYDNIEVNVDVPPNAFHFDPPEGIQVMDMTEGVINMFRGMKKQQP